MEPVTHLLTGACLARAGFNRKTAYATATMMVAAEFPDIDTLWSLRGPVEGLAHHRGITHTFLGLPFEAALLVAAAYGWHRLRAGTGTGARDRAGTRWGVLYGGVLVALLSHLLLDYTNNYGVRPFFPFNGRWYAGSFVFIFDPFLFLMLVGALVLPALFGLIGTEVGVRKAAYRGRGWAIAALLGMVCWWTLRAVEHGRAVELGAAQSIAAPRAPSQATLPGDAAVADTPLTEEPTPVYLAAQQVVATPDPISPFRWSVAVDFGPMYQLYDVSTLNHSVAPAGPGYPVPVRDAAVTAAEASGLGRAYMDWSSMPVVEVERDTGGDEVSFRDLRFMGGWLAEHDRTALVGRVRLDAKGRVVVESLEGRVER